MKKGFKLLSFILAVLKPIEIVYYFQFIRKKNIDDEWSQYEHAFLVLVLVIMWVSVIRFLIKDTVLNRKCIMYSFFLQYLVGNAVWGRLYIIFGALNLWFAYQSYRFVKYEK